MSTQTKANWATTRLPYAGTIWGSLTARIHAPDATYFSVFPFLLMAACAFLTLSGLVLAVYYNPWHAFDSVQFINRDVNNGWLIRAYHATGTTMIFGLAYLYMFRLVALRAYRAPGEFIWLLSVTLLALLLLTGWLGSVLTGGAAGYWSLVNAANATLSLGGLPGAIGTWFFGGPAGGGTLARLEIFHALLAISALLVIWLLRASRRAIIPASTPPRAVAFYPYYLAQYFAALAIFALIFAVLTFFAPHFGTSRLNAIPAGGLTVAVDASVPWYLAPAAGLLGVFPSALLAVLGGIAALAMLFALPWLDRSGPNGARGKLYVVFTWVLALDIIGLGFAANAASATATIFAVIFTIWYFFHFLVITPLVTAMEAE